MASKKKVKPSQVILRTYNVGFGDCFLLTFRYTGVERHVLIDFGTSSAPQDAGAGHMRKIAEDIRERCQGKLDALVVTHRHRDHLSGFATGAGTPGEVIAGLQPDLVVQPWTEDPDAPADGTPAVKGFVETLNRMHAVAEAAGREADGPQLRFLGEANLSNQSAVANLMEMGARGGAAYVHCGSDSGLGKLLPGVTVHVLGPPTLEQTGSIRKERERDDAEFWQFHAFWQFQSAAGGISGAPLFPAEERVPPGARWFMERARRLRDGQLLELVRALDGVLNNTSVILLFQVGRLKLLFSGDAQIENWAFALSQPHYKQLLKAVNLYKVGHHGSLNATPRSLWNLFAKKRQRPAPGRLRTVLSTKAGKHGSLEAHTEVPRRTLVTELQNQSDCFSTQDLGPGELYKEIEFKV